MKAALHTLRDPSSSFHFGLIRVGGIGAISCHFGMIRLGVIGAIPLTLTLSAANEYN